MNAVFKNKDRENLLLFLGAGFSHDAGLPLQNNFFEHVRNKSVRSLLDPYEYAGLTAAQMISSVGSTNNKDPNMETAFSMLDYIYYMKNDDFKLAHLWYDDFIPANNSQLGVEKLREQFLKALEKIFMYNRVGAYINHDLYYYFFEELLKKFNVYIITTNYDLVCESVFHKMIGVNALYFPVITYDEWPANYYPVPLLKLHGSIDWKETKYDLPNIIPPTWSKHFERKSKYNRIWSEAENAITISDKIIFIGYSMPETDTHTIFNKIRITKFFIET